MFKECYNFLIILLMSIGLLLSGCATIVAGNEVSGAEQRLDITTELPPTPVLKLGRITVAEISIDVLPTECQPDDLSQNTFMNREGHYCLQYPFRFHIQPPSGQLNETVIRGVPHQKGSSVQAALLIQVVPADGQTVAEYVERNLADNLTEQSEIVHTQIGGQDATIVNNMRLGPGHVRQALIEYNDARYVLNLPLIDAETHPTVAADAEELWETVLNSFTFIWEND